MAKGSIPRRDTYLNRCSPRIAAHRFIGDGDRIGFVANTISPATLDFGSQEAGTGTAKQTLTITNSSNSKTLSITSLAPSSAVYQVTADSCSAQTISAGGHCTFDNGFQPIANFASVNS
jgi:hypothetical protein